MPFLEDCYNRIGFLRPCFLSLFAICSAHSLLTATLDLTLDSYSFLEEGDYSAESESNKGKVDCGSHYSEPVPFVKLSIAVGFLFKIKNHT